MRAAVLPGAVMLDRFPDQIFIHRAEDFIGEIEGPDFLTAQIVYVDSCHCFCFSDHWPLATDHWSLRLLCRSLRRLQRIDRSRTRKSAALSWRFLRFRNNEIPTLRSGHAAFNDQKIFILVDAQHAQVTLRHARMPHVS